MKKALKKTKKSMKALELENDRENDLKKVYSLNERINYLMAKNILIECNTQKHALALCSLECEREIILRKRTWGSVKRDTLSGKLVHSDDKTCRNKLCCIVEIITEAKLSHSMPLQVDQENSDLMFPLFLSDEGLSELSLSSKNDEGLSELSSSSEKDFGCPIIISDDNEAINDELITARLLSLWAKESGAVNEGLSEHHGEEVRYIVNFLLHF
jgi:hypothetical protein